ncbi:ubiquitin metalloprotease fusion protein [Diaporthe amygdali]|uniref:ubiquitin metalloprotease fusion protein n=1 Tax=Phomopsis amygdali TaxID=1214568 RepID=UPI0022FE0822|nr:ubiquitin metalloprotease fusion protein [Diaporthe amygdali]KAJ0124631.1 ubiquitin metalloprotease fusion protein [Diaporthe amygdali]
MAEAHTEPSPNETPPLTITVSKGGKPLDIFHLTEGAILNDLLIACEDHLAEETNKYDWDKAKFIAKGKMLRASEHGEQPIGHLDGAKVTLQVPTLEAIQDLQRSSDLARSREARRQAQYTSAARPVAARRSRPDQARAQADAQYTFLRVEPLPGFSNAERSRAFLERLKEDPGIRAAMRKHKFSVGLLTEMDPASNTQSSHEGTTRLLGLNRNRGEVIELRLRTDAYDGYRDYKTIRATLCHELAHNVHGPHDRNFWDLCHLIEREVQAADWKSGGHSFGDGDYYESPEDDVPDHGGWTGGTYVLGGSSGSGGGGLSRRDVIAKAAEERMRRSQSDNPDGGSGEGSSSAAP